MLLDMVRFSAMPFETTEGLTGISGDFLKILSSGMVSKQCIFLGSSSWGSSLTSISWSLFKGGGGGGVEAMTMFFMSTEIMSFLQSFAAICFRLSRELSQSEVSISLRLVPSLSISANMPIGSLPAFSNFMM